MATELSRRQVLGGLAGLAAAPTFGTAASANSVDEIDYDYLGMFPPQSPAADMPYFYYRFDASTLESHPEFRPTLTLPFFFRDKFTLLNFVDPAHRERSIQQMRLMDYLAKELTPVIGPKQFLVADIFVRDNDGEALYVTDYELLYRDNQLGRDRTFEEDRIVPYGVAYSASLRNPDAGVQRLMDFSVSRHNPSDAQNEVNVQSIIRNLGGYAASINPDRLASLDLAQDN